MSRLILLRHPVTLMTVAVVLWTLYPPLINLLVERASLFQVAATAHSLAALSTLLFAAVLFARAGRGVRAGLIAPRSLRRAALPTAMSGLLICANHLLLYAALSVSSAFDVVAILMFETWPILFFYIDSAFRRDRRRITINDYVFSGAAFAGFLVLMVPNLDPTAWILRDSLLLSTVALAFAGGVAMAVNCYFRMKCMDAWQAVSTDRQLNLSTFRLGVLTETGVRAVAAPLFLAALFAFGEGMTPLPLGDWLLIAFVGVAILALGSMLYDLAVFRADSASIGVLWYLMPVGSIAILAVLEGRLLNQYEAVASVLIVASNVFLGLKYPLRSSLLLLFIAICAIGLWILAGPAFQIADYYDLLAVSTVFFVLLATFALDRTTALNRTRESHLVEFREKIERVFEHATPDDKPLLRRAGLYALKQMHRYLGAAQATGKREAQQRDLEGVKAEAMSLLHERPAMRDEMLSLFRVGEALTIMENDRITAPEYVVLILLGATNVVFSLVFRPDNLAAALFALIVAISMVYLLLIIRDRDKHKEVRADHAVLCEETAHFLEQRLPALCEEGAGGPLVEGIRAMRRQKTADRSVDGAGWVFAVFSFVVAGFGYGVFYDSVERNRLPERTPFASGAAAAGPVEIALLDWPSAQVKAHVLAEIIERYTRFDAALVPAANQEAFERMGRRSGDIDVHPEVWTGNVPDLIRRYVRAFASVALAETAMEGRQGICAMSDQESDNWTLEDLRDADVAKRFDVTGDGIGDIWTGAPDWASSAIEQRRLTAFGLDQYYEFHAFSQALLYQLLDGVKASRTPLFFCYFPDVLFTRPGIRFVAEVPHDDEAWQRLLEEEDVWSYSAWPLVDIRVAFRASLVESHAELTRLLNAFTIPRNDLVALIDEWQRDEAPREVARRWVDAHHTQVLSWLTGFDAIVSGDDD